MSEASRQNTVNIELFEAAAEGSVDGVNTALRKGAKVIIVNLFFKIHCTETSDTFFKLYQNHL